MFTFQKISSKFAGKKMKKNVTFKQTLVIAIINIVIFFSFFSLSSFNSNLPLYFATWKFESGLFAPYQLISYQFVHADLRHLLLNLLIFVPTSLYLESIVKSRLTYYFLVSGVIAGLFHLLMYQSNFPLVGASGSIWGLSVLLALLNKSIFLRSFVVISLLSEIYNGLTMSNDGVAHWCHVGGALGGLIIYFFENKLFKSYSM